VKVGNWAASCPEVCWQSILTVPGCFCPEWPPVTTRSVTDHQWLLHQLPLTTRANSMLRERSWASSSELHCPDTHCETRHSPKCSKQRARLRHLLPALHRCCKKERSQRHKGRPKIPNGYYPYCQQCKCKRCKPPSPPHRCLQMSPKLEVQGETLQLNGGCRSTADERTLFSAAWAGHWEQSSLGALQIAIQSLFLHC